MLLCQVSLEKIVARESRIGGLVIHTALYGKLDGDERYLCGFYYNFSVYTSPRLYNFICMEVRL